MKGFSIEDEAKRLKDEVFFLRLDSAVRVEGQDDKPFWATAFKAAVPQHKIRIFAESNYPTPGSTGKSNVLKFKRFADKELLLCVDADYDYLLQSRSVVGINYVFHTFAFSIENFFCNPAALQDLYLAVGGKADEAPDFEGIIKTYSRIIHPLLLLSVLSEKEEDGVFGTKKCGSAACPPSDWILEHPVDGLLDKMQQRVAEQVGQNAPTEAWSEQIHVLGATPENTWWFVRGHNWMDFMAQFVAVTVFRSHQSVEEQERQIPVAELGLFNEMHQQVTALLRSHAGYAGSLFFERVLGDIRRSLSSNVA